jgi:hypothetical protein
MSDYDDPFAGAPADEAQAPYEPPADTFNPPPADPEPEPTAPAKKAPAKKAAAKAAAPAPVVSVGADGKHVVTMKGGKDFDAPWYVVHASGLDELEELFNGEGGVRLAKLFERIQAASKHFAGLKVPSASGVGQARQAAPAAAQQAPGGEKRFCAHGEMQFKSDVSKAGKPYKGFFCTERDRNSQCKAQFLRD